MDGVLFRIRPAEHAVEDVVGGEMHQPGVTLPAGQRQVSDGQRIGLECCHRLALRNVDLVVGCGVENRERIVFGYRFFDPLGARNIDVGPPVGCNLITAQSQFRA